MGNGNFITPMNPHLPIVPASTLSARWVLPFSLCTALRWNHIGMGWRVVYTLHYTKYQIERMFGDYWSAWKRTPSMSERFAGDNLKHEHHMLRRYGWWWHWWGHRFSIFYDNAIHECGRVVLISHQFGGRTTSTGIIPMRLCGCRFELALGVYKIMKFPEIIVDRHFVGYYGVNSLPPPLIDCTLLTRISLPLTLISIIWRSTLSNAENKKYNNLINTS